MGTEGVPSRPPQHYHLEVDGGDGEQVMTHSGSTVLLCSDRVRHWLLSVRLRRAYFVYCGVCCAMSSVACVSTFHKISTLSRRGQSLADHSWDSWEIHLEVVIGLAVCTETSASLWLMGLKAFCKDWLCIVDSVVAALTLLSWLFLAVKQTLLAEDALETDLPMLMLRFMLQPCRMLSTASALRRVRHMQQQNVDIEFQTLDQSPARTPATPQSRILTHEIKLALLSRLPSWCRFKDWHLAYSPHVHGTSLQTFYRSQLSGVGAQFLLLKDAAGRVLGCFCTEPWRHNTRGFRASPECFLFASSDLVDAVEEAGGLVFYEPRPGHEVVLWCDESTLAFAEALVILRDFGFCESHPCPALGSPSLDAYGDGLHIVNFECWKLCDGIDDGS